MPERAIYEVSPDTMAGSMPGPSLHAAEHQRARDPFIGETSATALAAATAFGRYLNDDDASIFEVAAELVGGRAKRNTFLLRFCPRRDQMARLRCRASAPIPASAPPRGIT